MFNFADSQWAHKELFMSTTLLHLPIEPIEGRYSILWTKWFNEAFDRNQLKYKTILGDETGSEPTEGKFLDPYTTFQWKFSQLEKTLKWIKENENEKIICFLADGWFPGIESLGYVATMEQRNIKICSYWHAGAYDPTDLLAIKGMNTWVWGSEQTWLNIHDAIFIGSEYNKQKLLRAHAACPRIYVTGSPVEVPEIWDITKPRENIVVWPHRISQDKHPEVFERLSKEPTLDHAQFIRTQDQNLTKAEYFDLLSKSKVCVSTASHENFGTAAIESCMLGCYPVVPNALAYKETIEERYRYDSYEQMVELVQKCLQRNQIYYYPLTHKYNQITVTDKICEAIKAL